MRLGLHGELASPVLREAITCVATRLVAAPVSVRVSDHVSRVVVEGPEAEVARVAQVVHDMAGQCDRVTFLVREPGRLVYLEACRSDGQSSVSFEQLTMQHVGARARFELVCERGRASMRILAPDRDGLAKLVRAARDAAAPRLELTLDSLGPAPHALPPGGRDPGIDRVLLSALRAGHLEAEREASLRDVAAQVGLPRATADRALRVGIANAVRAYLDAWSARHGRHTGDEHPQRVALEYWGGRTRSAHYAVLMAENLHASIRSLHVTPGDAWQWVHAEGPQRAIERLHDAVASGGDGPILRLVAESADATSLSYFDHWRRPLAATEGISLEHELFDAAGGIGAELTGWFHGGAHRVALDGPLAVVLKAAARMNALLAPRFTVRTLVPGHNDGVGAQSAHLLHHAYKGGFFESPKRMHLVDLAAATRLGKSTIARRLRLAVRAAVVWDLPGACRTQHELETTARLPDAGNSPARV